MQKMAYTLKDVCALLNLPASTIRYYDREGLLPGLERTEGGYRRFSDDDAGLLRMIECLKRTGMPIRDIRKFTVWLGQGDASLRERYEMFQERKKAVQEQIAQLEETMKVIDHKCRYYAAALEAGTEAVHRGAAPCGDE